MKVLKVPTGARRAPTGQAIQSGGQSGSNRRIFPFRQRLRPEFTELLPRRPDYCGKNREIYTRRADFYEKSIQSRGLA